MAPGKRIQLKCGKQVISGAFLTTEMNNWDLFRVNFFLIMHTLPVNEIYNADVKTVINIKIMFFIFLV